MRCKLGDLAVITRVSRNVDRPHIGKIVELVGLDDGLWITNPELPSLCCPGMVVVWYDWELQPIRPSEGQDETLQWAEKPQEVTA